MENNLIMFFDRQLNIKESHIISYTTPKRDIISPQKTTIQLDKNDTIEAGDIVVIRNTNAPDYIGIVQDKETQNKTDVYIYPLINIFDAEVFMASIDGDVFTWIKQILTANFVGTTENPITDKYFALKMEFVDNTGGVDLALEMSNGNLLDALINIFFKTGVYVAFDLKYDDATGKVSSLICNVNRATDSNKITIRYDNPLLLEKPTIELAQAQSLNKIIYIPNENNTTHTTSHVFYLLDDNTVSQDSNSNKRIKNVVQSILEYNDDDYDNLLAMATDKLVGNSYDHSITLKVINNESFDFDLFKAVEFIDENKTYNTYVTHVENYSNVYSVIKLGVRRTNLTDKLKEIGKQLNNVATEVGNSITNVTINNNTMVFYRANGEEIEILSNISGGTNDYTELNNKPVLNTNNTASLTPVNEEINGTVSLHKISKTGNYEDLNNKPNTTQYFKDVSIDNDTGIFTFTRGDNSTKTIDTLLEKVVTNFTYNESTQSLELTLEDGSVKSVPMTAFIDDYTGSDGDIITISISNNNVISATIKEGSISLSKLTASAQNTINNKVDKVDGKGLSTNDYTNEEKSKLAGIEAGAEVNNPLYTTTGQNTDGAMTQKAVTDALSDVENSIPTALSELTQDATHRLVTDTEKSTWNAKSDFSGSYNDLTNKPTIPTTTSELTNDSNFVSDSNYVHTDNNYTTTEKNKLAGIESGAQKNPTTLPNPYGLTIKQNGVQQGYYDGGSEVEIDLAGGDKEEAYITQANGSISGSGEDVPLFAIKLEPGQSVTIELSNSLMSRVYNVFRENNMYRVLVNSYGEEIPDPPYIESVNTDNTLNTLHIMMYARVFTETINYAILSTSNIDIYFNNLSQFRKVYGRANTSVVNIYGNRVSIDTRSSPSEIMIGHGHVYENGIAIGTADANSGIAIGNGAGSSDNGIAIGRLSDSIGGIAIGKQAIVVDENGYAPIDAIQLGTGTNNTEKTLQVYNDNIYNANTHTLTAENLSLEGSFTALNNIGGGFSISDPTNVGIELGRRDGTGGTPYIDFHTDGGANTDYNARIIARKSQLEIVAGGGLKLNNSNLMNLQQFNSGFIYTTTCTANGVTTIDLRNFIDRDISVTNTEIYEIQFNIAVYTQNTRYTHLYSDLISSTSGSTRGLATSTNARSAGCYGTIIARRYIYINNTEGSMRQGAFAILGWRKLHE